MNGLFFSWLDSITNTAVHKSTPNSLTATMSVNKIPVKNKHLRIKT